MLEARISDIYLLKNGVLFQATQEVKAKAQGAVDAAKSTVGANK